jgi:Ca2+-binding EF-hand superfamily protein
VKYVKAFSGVRKLVIAVSGALLTLFWALVLLALLLYVFSIMLTSGVAQYYESVDIQSPAHTNITIIPPPGFEEKSHTEVIRFFYGGIFETMATLFQAITGGDWTVSANSVLPLNWTFYILWYGYIAFVLFGLLNVFTGIFVESATHAANADREIKIQAQMEEESSYLNQIRVIFARSDTDGSGKMTETELQELMTQEDFKEQMECLGIHSTEAHGLFKLLDDDGSGSVSIDEFLSGCIRLKGTAKAVDMITLLFETNKLNRKVGKILKCITDGGGQIDCSPPSGAASNAGDDDSANGKSAPSSPRMLPRSMSQISF